MASLSQEIRVLLESQLTDDQFVTAAGLIFFHFGYIHPFLDGNGHIQRLVFGTLVVERGLRLSSAWTIHPRAVRPTHGNCP
jgi:Fic family protein